MYLVGNASSTNMGSPTENSVSNHKHFQIKFHVNKYLLRYYKIIIIKIKLQIFFNSMSLLKRQYTIILGVNSEKANQDHHLKSKLRTLRPRTLKVGIKSVVALTLNIYCYFVPYEHLHKNNEKKNFRMTQTYKSYNGIKNVSYVIQHTHLITHSIFGEIYLQLI